MRMREDMDLQSQREARIYSAANIEDPEGVSEATQRVVTWLAGWDREVMDVLDDLLTAAYVAGWNSRDNEPCRCPEGEAREQLERVLTRVEGAHAVLDGVMHDPEREQAEPS